MFRQTTVALSNDAGASLQGLTMIYYFEHEWRLLEYLCIHLLRVWNILMAGHASTMGIIEYDKGIITLAIKTSS